MKMKLPENVNRIIHRLQKEGYDAYAVGGHTSGAETKGLGYYDFCKARSCKVFVFPYH